MSADLRLVDSLPFLGSSSPGLGEYTWLGYESLGNENFFCCNRVLVNAYNRPLDDIFVVMESREISNRDELE